MLELDCTAAGRGRTTYPIAFVQASADLQTVTGLGDGDTLTGCTALLSFVAAKDGVTMSIQNPVVVDP